MSRRPYIREDFTWQESILGRDYPFTFDPNGEGRFTTAVAGSSLWARTKPELIEKVKRAVQKYRVKVQVPCTMLDRVFFPATYGRGHWGEGLGVRHLTLTGTHAATGKILAKFADGETTQVAGSYHSRYEIVQRLTPTQEAEYRQVRAAQRAAEEAWHAWLATVRFDPEDALKAAIATKIDTPPDED